MKKYFLLMAIACCVAASTTSCSKDENGEIPIEKNERANTTTGKTAALDPGLNFGNSATYLWSVEQAGSELYSLTGTTEEKAVFLSSAPGNYKLKLTAEMSGVTYVRNFTVTVGQPANALSPYIAKIHDFLPAPGQCTNNMPEYISGDTKEAMIAKAAQYIVGKKNGGLISLGGFGGYIVFGFDHTIVNVNGKRDFRIMGNAFFAADNPNPDASQRGGQCEPGIVVVSYDANKNGLPDDPWYEIAGSEYYKSATIKNYEMTYHRPAAEEPEPGDDMFVAIENYIRWTDNQGASGYKVKNTFYSQSYYPGWIASDRITYKGTMLTPNGINESNDPDTQYWVLYAYGHGYADNALNTDDDSAIDIGWAVDANGVKVELPGIDFVKVYTGVNQECGWLGENSTEIAGAYDLHLAGESIETIE